MHHRYADLMTRGGPQGGVSGQRGCCPLYHEAIELIGRRWTGAIVEVLLQAGEPLRFSEIAHTVPQLSDRMLSERMKELEERGVVERCVDPGPPVRVEALKAWAREWLDPDEAASAPAVARRSASAVRAARPA
jgi:DNA-binding HxlR family transcriptional regulator